MVSAAIKNKTQDLIKSNPIFVASKSYCPYCKATKARFAQLGVEPYVIELDEVEDGDEIQAALLELSSQRTVPNIFIGGEHIGGNSDLNAYPADKLQAKIKAAL